jgi:hypothetical protein
MAILSCSVVALVSLPGCVAPGSSIGHLSVRGSLQSATGEPLANREVELILPAAYGLGGLDVVLNDPEDFGHQDRSFTVTTDSAGEFSRDLGDHVYHAALWILPPLGAFPRHPPPPFLLVRVPSFPGEYYAVQTHDGKFKVFGIGGTELRLREAALSELSATSESGTTNDQRWTVGVIDLWFRAH